MRKLAMDVGSDVIEEAPRRSRWPRVLMVLFLVLGFLPLAIDGAAVFLGNWKTVLGVSSDVRTPTLDRVAETLHDLSDVFWGQITPHFRKLPWEPQMVIPAGAVIMALSMMMLRR